MGIELFGLTPRCLSRSFCFASDDIIGGFCHCGSSQPINGSPQAAAYRTLPATPPSDMKKIFLLLFSWTAAVGFAADAGWRELFNGKDLAGWKANADPGAFTIVDGAIKAHATHPSNRGHLFYAGQRAEGLEPFKNFELEAIVRGEPGANSGIFFHTDMETRDGRLHLKNGYEVQLNSSATERRKTGSLYAIVDIDKSPVDEAQWFTVKISVRDRRIVIQINGQTTVDYTEPPGVVAQRPADRKGRVLKPEGGAIALQAHDDKSTFYFKSIRVRPLP